MGKKLYIMAFSTLQNTFTPTLVESTAEQELLKKKWHQETRFFLASENEEWILLEKPVNLETRHYMCHSFWLTRAVRPKQTVIRFFFSLLGTTGC